MSFLYPSFLWALLVVLVPIIIHLLNLQRTVKLDFSSIQFLEEAKKETSSKQKLKHWLILAARCLFITFLVLAFTQPFFSDDVEKENFADFGIYIDNSLSMENQPNSEITALEEAKQLAIEWVNNLPDGQGVSLLSNNFFQKYQSKKKLIERIGKIDLSSQTLSFDDIHRKLSLSKSKQNVLFLSDFQRNSFSDINKLKKDSSNQLNLVALNQGNEKNTFIDSVWIESSDQISQKTRLAVRVGANGLEKAEKVSVKLYLKKVFSIDHVKYFNFYISLCCKNSGFSLFSITYVFLKFTSDWNLKHETRRRKQKN